ncbi:MAG TPA: branched-chain amino acid ABC transporter permease [Acidisphaera sp.]|nr:branched-chain amino acid ABC transporter permease [Acidisphaera sp.]
MELVQALLSGVLVGGVYGLFAMGFSLAFGVMRIVNFAHGELVMIGMYVGFFAFSLAGIDPLLAVPVALVLVGALGAGLYRLIYRRFVGRATLQQLLVAIALALVLQTLAQILVGPDAHAVQSGWGSRFLLIGPIFLPYAELAAFAVALVCVVGIELLLGRWRWGQMIRAVADDPEIAELVGMNAQRVNIVAFALSAGLAGLAGAVLVMYYPVSPVVGATLMPIALIATVLGGLGSIGGAFIGGILCGIVEQVTSLFWNAALQDVPLYVLLLVIMAFLPQGLFGRQSAH